VIRDRDLVDVEREMFFKALRSNTHYAWTLTKVNTIFELVGAAHAQPIYFVAISADSPELGKFLVSANFVPIGSSQEIYDITVAQLAEQLEAMRTETMERLGRNLS
jgi:hypothetical protein